MAIKYRISESGIQKVVEVVSDGVVIGKRKFSPKEIVISYSGDTVQIQDEFSGTVLYEGEYSDFIDSNNNTFANSAAGVTSSITAVTDKISINVSELQGINILDGVIAPDLSAYAQISYVDQEITSTTSTLQGNIDTVSSSISTSIAPVSSALSTVETSVSELDNKVSNIPKIIAQSPSFNLNFSRPYRTRCHVDSGVTFTAPANGKVAYLIENYRYSVSSMGNVIMYISAFAPPTTPITTIDEETDAPGDTSVFLDYIDTNVEPLEVPGNTGGSHVTPPVLAQSSMQTTASIEFIIGGLTPGQQYTWYLWLASFIFANSNTTNIQFINGVKIKEVL
jgi:hypothetical protein